MNFKLLFSILFMTALVVCHSQKAKEQEWDGECECPNSLNMDLDSLANVYVSGNPQDPGEEMMTLHEHGRRSFKVYNMQNLQNLNVLPLDLEKPKAKEVYRISCIYPEEWLLDIWVSDSATHFLYKAEDYSYNKRGIGLYEFSLSREGWSEFKQIIELEFWSIPVDSEPSKLYTLADITLRLGYRSRLDASGATNYHGPAYMLEGLKDSTYHITGQHRPGSSKLVDDWVAFAQAIIEKLPGVDCKFRKRKCPEAFEFEGY